MLPKADFLLQRSKEAVDTLVAKAGELQDFITLIERKVNGIKSPYLATAVRAFYYTLFRGRDLNLAISLDEKDEKLGGNLKGDLALDLALSRAFGVSLSLIDNPELKQILQLGFSVSLP